MKKIILLIVIILSYTAAYADKVRIDSLPVSIKHVDSNNDNIITTDETRTIFEKYLLNEDRELKNDLINDVESTMIDIISFMEGADFSRIKGTSAAKKFIEVYFVNKFETNFDISAEIDSIIVAEKEKEKSFDDYLSVGAQIISLHQRVINPSKNTLDDGSSQPNSWPSETMVIFDLPVSFKPWKNASFDVMPEFTAGNAIGGAVGMGGFVNGIYGATTTQPILFRAQFSQLFETKKETCKLKSVEVKLGKMNMLDLFDYNAYSGDPYADFLNYNHIMPAAWDYAGTMYGNTYGAGFKLDFKKSQLNFAAAAVNSEPAGEFVDWNLKEAHGLNLQYVRRFSLGTKKGSIRAIGFYNRVFSGKYTDASTDTSTLTYAIPDSLKKYQVKTGFAFDADLAINEQLGVFARYSWNNGKTEAMHYTEADESINLGMIYNFSKFDRPNDKFGLAVSMNSLSNDHKNFIENGGSGFMLVNGISAYQKEFAFEAFYDVNLFKYTTIGLNYQYIVNPGYNSANAATSFIACRLNFTFE